MKGYIAFVKKEFVENLKNYRFLILFAIFAVFGMLEIPVQLASKESAATAS